MNKKILLFIIILVIAIITIGCSSEKSTAEGEIIARNENDTEDVTEKEKEKEKENIKDVAEEETDIGLMTIYKTNDKVNLEQQSGPFIVKVLKSRLSTLEVNEDSRFMFNGKDKVTILTLYIEAENTNGETNFIYPDQGTIVTNTKEQIECNMWLSDNIGGDFIGKVIKEGNIFFVLDSQPEEITEIKYIISGAHDENLDNIGEDITFELNF